MKAGPSVAASDLDMSRNSFLKDDGADETLVACELERLMTNNLCVNQARITLQGNINCKKPRT
jgi:hypothetical protein